MAELVLASLVVFALAAPAAAAPVPALEADHALVTAFATPHTEWARPYARGTTRVLVFCRGDGTAARDWVELFQRFDLAGDAVFRVAVVDTDREEWHGGAAGIERIRALLARDHDVYAFAGVAPALLAADADLVLERVRAGGAGVVLVGVDDPRFTGDRVVRVDALPARPFAFGWETAYDHDLEGVGRAVLAAASRLPPAGTLDVRLAAAAIDRAVLPAALAAVTVGRAGARLEARIRRADDGFTVALRGRARRPTLVCPTLAAGDYHLDLRLLRDRRVEDWRTLPFAVTADRRPRLTLTRTSAEIGERITGSVAIDGALHDGDELGVELRGRHGRILARSDGPSIDLAVPAHFPMLVEVRATIRDRAGEVARDLAYVNVVKRHRERFNFLVWDVPDGPAAPLAEEALSRLGMTLQLARSAPPLHAAAFDVAWVPYTTRILAEKDERGWMKPAPWSDDEAIGRHVAEVVAAAAPARRHGVFAYSLGDETVTRGADASPSDLAAFRAYLGTAHGDIARLNAGWGTSFASFDQVTVPDPVAGATVAAQYDRLAWETENFVRLCRRFRAGFGGIDPAARVGIEGSGNVQSGDDLETLADALDFLVPYPGPGDPVLAGIAPPGLERSNWIGYDHDAASLTRAYWRAVLHGAGSVWWWRWDGLGRFHGLLRPTLDPYPAAAEMLARTQVVRDGLGDLLARYALLDDGIAIVCSHPSAVAAGAGAGPSYGSFAEAHLAWQSALQGLGLAARYVTLREVSSGALALHSTTVLILPRVEALGDEAAAAIERFAAAGGTVIADLRPGRRGARLEPRPEGALDHLFGVTAKDSGAASVSDAKLATAVAGRFQNHVLAGLTVDPGVRSAGSATPLGTARGMPVVLVRPAGKGLAILLNFALARLAEPAGTIQPLGFRPLLREILAAAGVRPRFAVTPPDGIHVASFGDGEARILGLGNEREAAASVTVTLPEPLSVHDLKTGTDLGILASFPAEIDPGDAAFFALFPAAPPPLRLSLSSREARRGAVLELRLAAPGAPGAAAMQLTARTPDGTGAPWLDTIAVLPPGDSALTVPIPIALNDPAGTYRLVLREVLTGRVHRVSFRVREDPRRATLDAP